MFSVVIPNRNRLESLKAVISSWQSQKLISEIIVVDYGSENPIRIDDFPIPEKVKIVRVEGADDWRIGHAINIGVDWAANRYICKLDSDVLIETSDWINSLDLASSFFRGHFQTAVPNGEVLFQRTIGRHLEDTVSGLVDTDLMIPIFTFD
jgi:glycosyltransferase involved in cell wall biosynthesis